MSVSPVARLFMVRVNVALVLILGVAGTMPFVPEYYPGENSPERHGHFTLSLTVIGCHSVGICRVILRPLLSFSAKMAVSCPWPGEAGELLVLFLVFLLGACDYLVSGTLTQISAQYGGSA